MRAVVQRVRQSAVKVDDQVVGQIGSGLLVLLGVARNDSAKDADYLVNKIIHLRIFEDAGGKMNQSLLDTGGELLAVSQFTLLGDCRKGRRPGFTDAAEPELADMLYEDYVGIMQQRGINVATGIFRAEMKVGLINDGPVTILLDSRKQF